MTVALARQPIHEDLHQSAVRQTLALARRSVLGRLRQPTLFLAQQRQVEPGRCGQAIDDGTAQFHVGLGHAAGQVDRQHQVAPARRRRDGVAELLRPGHGGAQQEPHDPSQRGGPPRHASAAALSHTVMTMDSGGASGVVNSSQLLLR